MAKYLKITRSDTGGSYTEEPKNIANAIDGELSDIDYLAAGTVISFEVVEMTPEEYAALPEFMGW